MTAKVLMVQGASSSAGKSLLTAALCRIYKRRGVRVAPFKAQNMSNNAAVCPDGSEIGRAQAVQAVACDIEPSADMNPILLKPEADARSQVVVLGRPWHNLAAREYYKHKHELWDVVAAALDRLRAQYDLVIMEGAGSPVELNLKEGDIVNMAVARYANSPVLLVGDIDRGGIFAQLLGTLWLLPEEERSLLRGFLVNKFRGDPTLFTDGVRILEERSGVPVLGVIPYLAELGIPEEDAVALEQPGDGGSARLAGEVEIAVIRLPRIANFDDFDPLAAEPGVHVRYVAAAAELGEPQAIIIPGTKATVADLSWLRAQGLGAAIRERVERGAALVGICGGYQMLGQTIHDPAEVESRQVETAGLGMLPIQTTFEADKATHRASAVVAGGTGWLRRAAGERVTGYEIHMGRTLTPSPWLTIEERSGEAVSVADGAVSDDGRIWGCYLHGLFENSGFRRAWLRALGWQPGVHHVTVAELSEKLDRLAIEVEKVLDMERLEKIVWES
jgi:adenosylcobyric acid synthase